jgi:hypothetical protein
MTAVRVVRSRNARVSRCRHCSEPLPKRVRKGTLFCSAVCRSSHFRRRRKTARALERKAKCSVCRKRLPVVCRADTAFCSAACRQAAFRKRKAAAIPPAHQHLIRLRLAAQDGIQIDVPDIRSAVVREITRSEATPFILENEWLGTMPAVSRYHFGMFFGERLGGVVVFGDEYGENLGVWDKYGYTGQIITLQRGACAHWAHPHTASKLIRRAMDLLPDRYRVITASVDPAAGEIGAVYQACGFSYVGVMSGSGRAMVRVNGKVMSERVAGKLVGTQGVCALSRLGFDAISMPRRARYFAFRGDKRTRRTLEAAIAHLVKPYPKRVHVMTGRRR